MHQEGRFYRLSTGRAAHYENIKPHNPSTEDWCIPQDMEEGDYLMMATEKMEKQHVDPEYLVLSMTILKDFLVERDLKELSLPVYDPNMRRLLPRELYALIHLISSDTNIQVFLQKKYYLSMG